MQATLLGSGCALPDPERGAPGIAVAEGGFLLLLDCGADSLHGGARFGVPVMGVDAVLLSHLHPDHTGGLVPFLFALRNPETARQKDLTLVGPEGIRPFLEGLDRTYGEWTRPRGYRMEIRSLCTQASLSLGPFGIRTLAVPHGPPALAYEIAGPDGSRLVYSGDTEYSATLAVFARGADLLVLECSFPEGEDRAGHLTPSTAGRIAAEAGCGKLLLTHFYPACRGEDLLTPCRGQYSGPVLLGHDGMRVSVP